MKKNPTPLTEHEQQGSRNLGRLIMQLRRLERQPHTFGSAGPLTPSEIHTITAIGTEGNVLMSELASRLGITKGAVTQLIARLEAKELVVRSPHPYDARGIVLSLTALGQEANAAHDRVHLDFYNRLRTQLSAQEIEIFEKCIDKLNHFLQQNH
ncbi:MarR family winged helix-turn-helix transcriptional regulator [Paenibacillus lutimineralis]|uniref:MarR family transcriptional regulator n=1 Tax=Paenibacillus lutimineralis TaxID=2707005 RepID=A0A3S9V113_9BACL|nr:MarR family transcriptional regulator [Paenibacillus lutimineralis]AZS16295.1 MarR family transcriptional regulator [Paenibacillus lutimineralis]